MFIKIKTLYNLFTVILLNDQTSYNHNMCDELVMFIKY